MHLLVLVSMLGMTLWKKLREYAMPCEKNDVQKLTLRQEVASTRRPGALAVIGGFAGELDLAEAGYSNGGVLVRELL